MAVPLRAENRVDAPEALLISALLDSGMFTPEKYHLDTDDLSCWRKLWELCVEHQHRTGHAPPMSLVRLKFPEFVYTPDVSPAWAAGELHREAAKRALRTRAAELIAAIRDDDLDKAYSLFEGVTRHKTVRKDPMGLFDHAQDDDEFEVSKIRVPFPTLGRVTGGIAPAELWYLAGRPGIGKTYLLCLYAALAVLEGYTVRYVSLEMSGSTIRKRVRRTMAGLLTDGGWAILAQLDSLDREEVKKGIDALRERAAGTFDVVDPSYGRATNAFVREQQTEADLVMVDHVGLMWTTDGRKAIDDWRAQASISNILREDTLSTGTSVVAAVQLNRKAEAGSGAHKIVDLSGSDALGQDGNVIITVRKLSERVRLHSAEKNREGPGATWYSEYNPDRAAFAEISRDKAHELASLDEEELG